MKKQFTILGCGSSLGSPWINQNWGKCKKSDPRNTRTRCSLHINYGPLSLLIDTSPDIRQQMIQNKIKSVDGIFYTHEHADQIAGIFEFRGIFMSNRNVIPLYCNVQTKRVLKKSYPWLFKNSKYYPKIMYFKSTRDVINLKKNNAKLKITAFKVEHGLAKTRGYLFDKVAYISDFKSIPNKSLNLLKNLNYLIVDCFKYQKWYTHSSFDETMEIIKFLKPKKSILTNLHIDMDYTKLKKKLPRNVVPAFDGLKVNF